MICEDCWEEAGRRQAGGDTRSLQSIYNDVLEIAELAEHGQGSAPWCNASREIARLSKW